MAIKVKHFRLETSAGKKYLLVAVPVDFGRLVPESGVEAVPTEGIFLVVVSPEDSYVESDPVGWVSFDRAVMLAHFYIRENLAEIRDKSVLLEKDVERSVSEALSKINPRLLAPGAPA